MVALLSRRRLVLPYSYFATVLETEGDQKWTFFELNGCPRELLVHMTHLCILASRQSDRRPSTRKNIARLVQEIETSLQSYTTSIELGILTSASADRGVDEEEEGHLDRDRYHCCEAFRCCLLIYILRIFVLPNLQDYGTTTRKSHQAKLSVLARMTLDHVRSCRASTAIHKQMMFPVFLAGAETTNVVQQGVVQDYCKHWHDKLGYKMFDTVREVVEELWLRRDVMGEELWWGDILDARRQEHQGEVDFCFG